MEINYSDLKEYYKKSEKVFTYLLKIAIYVIIYVFAFQFLSAGNNTLNTIGFLLLGLNSYWLLRWIIKGFKQGFKVIDEIIDNEIE